MQLSKFKFKYRKGTRYLGSHIGVECVMRSWLEPKIQKWVEAIKVMGHAAKRYPQTAYAGMTRSLMCEWQYL